ncbi:hypothetical protein LguiA_004826 [Lonicera macranthoides]
MGQWSNLPLELVQSLDECLEFVDKIRVRAVCVMWNSYLPKMPKLQSSHLPWLLHACEDNTKGISLYSPHEEKVYPLNLPEVQQTLFKGSSRGWVFTVEDVNSTSVDDIYLIHPLTRARIQLPPRSTLPDVKEYCPNRVGEEYAIKVGGLSDIFVTNQEEDESHFYVLDAGHMSLHLMQKLLLSSSPSSDDCVVVAIYGEFSKLAWCKCGDIEWTPLYMYPSGPRQPAFIDALFHNGKLHALNARGKLVVFESIAPEPNVIEVVAEAPYDAVTDPMYLVECYDGELIMVGRYSERTDDEIYIRSTNFFKVWKLVDSINNSKCWVQVKNIGDNVLFVGLNSCFSISARDFIFLGYKENCIYFTDEPEAFGGKMDNQQHSDLIGGKRQPDSDIGLFNLANGKIESLPGFKFCSLEPETVEHLLALCLWAGDVLGSSRPFKLTINKQSFFRIES